jgi:hypothetical protein
MVWLIRVLIIGTFSIAGENLFSIEENRPADYRPMRPSLPARPAQSPAYARPAPKPASAFDSSRPLASPEPTYHLVGMSAKPLD